MRDNATEKRAKHNRITNINRAERFGQGAVKRESQIERSEEMNEREKMPAENELADANVNSASFSWWKPVSAYRIVWHEAYGPKMNRVFMVHSTVFGT